MADTNEQSNKSNRMEILLRAVFLFLCILGLFSVEACRKKSPVPIKKTAVPEKEEAVKKVKAVLRSSLAGRWYSDDAETLSKQIEGFFQKTDIKSKDNVIALILPHAGYTYSGQTAAFGLKTIGREYKRIVIIGPGHYVPMEEILSVPRVTHYETPLGRVALDVEFIDKLLEYRLFQNVPQAHKREHSVQIEVPLLQYSRKDFKIVPIVAGTCSPKTINKAAEVLKSLIDSETLVIASSDFVHYGSNYGYIPFKENAPEKIKELDMGAYRYIASLDCKGFLRYKRRTGATICGYIPVAILLSMLEKSTEGELVKYATSGELTGDFTNSVSYLSVSFTGEWPSNRQIIPLSGNEELTDEDKKQLLYLARKSIVYALQNRQIPQASKLGVRVSEAMRDPGAAFVTFKKHHYLRGCIGDIFPRRPLYKSVISNAINAGINDRRFLPVTIAECNDITIEISVLTAPKPIASPNDIRIGIDGVVLHKNGRSAVFLPQVAPEQGWDKETMLRRLSLKAGLTEDAWKEGARFLVFQAVVFGESEK